MNMVSNRFTLFRTCSCFAEEMLARLVHGSGRRISKTSFCFSDEKFFSFDAVAPGRYLHTFSREKQARRNNAGFLLLRPVLLRPIMVIIINSSHHYDYNYNHNYNCNCS